MRKHKLGAEQGLQKSLEGLSWTAQRRKGIFSVSCTPIFKNTDLVEHFLMHFNFFPIKKEM